MKEKEELQSIDEESKTTSETTNNMNNSSFNDDNSLSSAYSVGSFGEQSNDSIVAKENVEKGLNIDDKESNTVFTDNTRSRCSITSVTNSEISSVQTNLTRKSSCTSDCSCSSKASNGKNSCNGLTGKSDKTDNSDHGSAESAKTTPKKAKRHFEFDDNQLDNTIKKSDEFASSNFQLLDGTYEDRLLEEVQTPKNTINKSRLIDSDSDDESDKPKIMKKTFKLFDSESDEEPLIEPEPVYTFNAARELVPEQTNMESRLTKLCDPDTSDEETENIMPLAYKRKLKKGEPKENKMTGKEAMEQRLEIESESQRQLRDKHVSLPYHKPKQRSLKEFLEKRPKFASAIPMQTKAPAALAIKMTSNQLHIISRNIKEREEQMLDFFKSESEDSESEGDNHNIHNENKEQETKELLSPNNQISLENETKNAEEQEIPSSNKIGDETIEENLDVGHCEIKVLENIVLSTAQPQIDQNLRVTNLLQMKQDESSSKLETNENISEKCENKEGEILKMEETKEMESLKRKYIIEEDDDNKLAINNIQKNEDDKDLNILKTTRELLMEKVGSIQPRLSGGPNFLIDLDQGITRPDQVTELMNRFMQHTSKKGHHPHKVELNITNVSSQGDIQKEKVLVDVEDAEEPPINEKPGVKLQQLRNDLQKQMAQRRSELWKQKCLEKDTNKNDDEDVYDGEKSDCGLEDDYLDDEEEEEDFSDAESTDVDADEGNEEDDVPTTKSEFFDEEADEDEDELENDDAEHLEDSEEILMKKPMKKMKRIIFPKDDEESDIEEDTCQNNTQLDTTVSVGEDDDCLQAGQTRNSETPQKYISTQSKDLGFLSPVCRMTGLQSFDGTIKYQSPGSPAIRLYDPSPLKSRSWQKSLFSEAPKEEMKQSVEDLSHLCSGDFPTQSQEANDAEPLPEEEKSCTQDLLDMCSGEFPDMPQSNYNPTETTQENKSIDYGEAHVENNVVNEDEDKLISQILAEEEMEIFKKKFESPLAGSSETVPPDEAVSTKLQFDEDEDDEELIKLPTKKQPKNRIVDSDASDNEDAQNEDDEMIELHDEDNYEEYDSDNEELTRNPAEIAYDSDENEIILDETEDQKKKKFRINNFVENEAELSESEWGSEDEDERNLDDLEFEEGDNEKFNEKKIKRDLVKLHMQQELVEDKQKLKVLRELYMEDEDLQGAGRQRQFRWKNIDYSKDDGNPHDESENIIEEEENDEEGWRKQRYERELFLKSQKHLNTDEDNCDLTSSDSQVFRLAQKAIIKSNMTVGAACSRVKVKQAFTLNTQRGSFLTRKDQVLARVAEYTKVADTAIGGAKNSRGFLFQSVTNTTTSLSDPAQEKKRKATEGSTPLAIKKLRLNGLSPANQKRGQTDTKKRLFNHSKW